MAATFREWKERGHAHLAEGRALDALSCFRKAARLKPGARGPLVGIAEAMWKLGRSHDAIAAWQESLKHKADDLPTMQAVLDAAAWVGDAGLAREMAARILAASPENRRAAFVSGCLALADPGRRDDAAAALVDLGHALPRLAAHEQLGRLLAQALAACGPDACVPLRRVLARHPENFPLSLVAQVARFVEPRLLERAVERDVAAGDVDDLRLLAAAIAHGIGTDGDGAFDEAARALAQRAATRYGALCVEHFASDVPLLGARRAAGDSARIIVLVDAATTAGTAGAPAWMAALRAVAADADLALAIFGDADAFIERHRASLPAAVRATLMPARPDIESARSLASLDPDLLLDLTGPARGIGPLLAARPARRIATIAGAPHYAPPLVDGVLDPDPAQWRRWVAGVVREAMAAPAMRSTPAQRAARLADAVAAHEGRRLDDALAAYEQLVDEDPGNPTVLHLRGAVHRELGSTQAAAADFSRALEVAPADVKSRAALAQVLLAMHRAADARRLVEDAPRAGAVPDVRLMRVLGHVALAQRDGPAAVNAFAAALQRDPLDAETHFNHGVALQMLRYLGDAARAYQRSLDIRPDFVDAHFNLGVVFDELGNTDAAITAFEHVLTREPRRAGAHRALLNVLARSERGAAWRERFLRFESRCPDAIGLVANALEYYQYAGDYAKVQSYLDRLAREEFKAGDELDLVDSLEQLLYLMLFFDIAPEAQRSLYATYDQAARRVYGEPLPRLAERKAGPLRVGYLSADFRDHVMGKMMLAPLRHHDRARHAIYLYSTAVAEDRVTADFRAMGHHFVELARLSDADAVARIDEDDLDVLVDLSTHTRGARPGILARKPARVAITHVASAGALGMSAIDFKLTDRLADVEENGQYLVERLLWTEGCVYPMRRIEPSPDPALRRRDLGIADDAVVIGAFVTPLKLSRRTMALWREILERLPDARLAFSPNAGWLQGTYPAILASAGVDPARAVFIPQLAGDEANLARYALVDLVLDPMPFGNVNGTFEPLSMHVPVVTLRGRMHGERTGYSILAHLGETRTVATTGKEYVEIAVRLGTDPAFMRDVRASIASRLAQSALADPVAYIRDLESTYARALAGVARPEEPGDAVGR